MTDLTFPTSAELLREAQELIRRDGWVQGDWRCSDGYCMLGSVIQARVDLCPTTGASDTRFDTLHCQHPDCDGAYYAARRRLEDITYLRQPTRHRLGPIGWNDETSRDGSRRVVSPRRSGSNRIGMTVQWKVYWTEVSSSRVFLCEECGYEIDYYDKACAFCLAKLAYHARRLVWKAYMVYACNQGKEQYGHEDVVIGRCLSVRSLKRFLVVENRRPTRWFWTAGAAGRWLLELFLDEDVSLDEPPVDSSDLS